MSRKRFRSDGILSRCDQLLMTPIEKKMSKLVRDIEKIGTHPLLTQASILVQDARDKIADYVELEEKETSPVKYGYPVVDDYKSQPGYTNFDQ